MRRVIFFNMVSLDGFFEGPNRDIDWHNVDEEFNEFAIEQLAEADGLIFGRETFVGMASYWPTPVAIENDPVVAKIMNAIPKFVFSNTLDKVEWTNSTLIKGSAVEEVAMLKQEEGKDLFIFGSADLASTLTRHGLIDEYRIIVNPVVLGSGNPLFKDVTKPIRLNLQKTRAFRNGNVLLYYSPDEPLPPDRV